MNLFTYGDSWTAGDGISKHLKQKKYCWPARLGEMLDIDLNFDFQEEHCLFNRSWGGISNYRLVDYFIEDSRTIKKEDIVVFGLTDPQRLTFWCDGKDSKVWLKASPRGYSSDRTPEGANREEQREVTNADKAIDVNFVDLLGSDQENILFRIGLFDERWMIYNLWLHIVIVQEICKKIGCKYYIFAPFFKLFYSDLSNKKLFDFSKPPISFSKIIDYKHISKKSATEEVLMKDNKRIKSLFAMGEVGGPPLLTNKHPNKEKWGNGPWPTNKHPNEDGYFEIAKWVYKKLGELDVSE